MLTQVSREVRLKSNGAVHEHCTLADKVYLSPSSSMVSISEHIVHCVYARMLDLNDQVNGWVHVSYFGSGRLQSIREAGCNDPCRNMLELEASA